MFRRTIRAQILEIYSIQEYAMSYNKVSTENMADICMRPELHHKEILDFYTSGSHMTVPGYSYEAKVAYTVKDVRHIAEVHISGAEEIPVPGKDCVRLTVRRYAPEVILEVVPP